MKNNIIISIIIPYYKNKKGNPVLFCRSYFEKLMKIKGDSGAKEIIENNPNDFCVLNIYDKGILEDIDNKEQYNNFIKDEKKY